MKYSSEVQMRRRGDLGFPWAAAIPAVASVATDVLSLVGQERQRDYADERAEQQQALQLLSQQAQAEIAQLQQTLPSQLSEAEAERILQTGAEAERQQALQTWQSRFSGLPNASQFAEHVATQVQNAYLDAAGQVTGRARLKTTAGWALLAAGAGLGAYTLYQRTQD